MSSSSQIAVVFSVENDRAGLAHVTYRSWLNRGHVGGAYLPQYSGRRRDMDTLAQKLQIDYDKARV